MLDPSRSEAAQFSRASARVNLDTLPTFDYQAYSAIGLNDLLAYAVWVLDGFGHPTTFENITVAVHKMFPARFSLVGYPEYPDGARVQLVVLHLGPKYVGWLQGKKKTGYYLNDRGVQTAQRVGQRLQQQGSDAHAMVTSLEEQQDNIVNRTSIETRLANIKNSKSYKLYREGKSHEVNDIALVWDVFQLFITADDATKVESYRGLSEATRRLADSGVQEFLAWIAKDRPHVIGKAPRRKRQ